MHAIRRLSASLAVAVAAIATLFAAAVEPTHAHSSGNRHAKASHAASHDSHHCRYDGRRKDRDDDDDDDDDDDRRRHKGKNDHEHASASSRPVADAGPDQAAHAGQTVTLDGSRSRDADGDELKYRWELIKRPRHSKARLAERRNAMPTIEVDRNGRYVAMLVVKACDGASKPDFVLVSVSENLAPVANAGADQSAFVGDVVQLDGGGSSDPNGDTLAFDWQWLSVPSGSQAALSDTTAVRPTFSPDLTGQYAAQLTVNDGHLSSVADLVTIHTERRNLPPTANAGPDQSSRIGETIVLDASASSDPDGDALSYEWRFVSRPDGSTTVLQGADDPQSTFSVDVEGQYVVEVEVCDASLCSDPDSAVVTAAGNTAPVAVPGADQTVDAGATVMLDGSGSTDADGDPLSYTWALTATPSGSAAQLDDPSALTPSFAADLAGDYLVQLTVNDGRASSAPATSVVTAMPAGPRLSIRDVTVTETDIGTRSAAFSVTLSEPVSMFVTVRFTTVDGTATVGGDYSFRSGSLSFSPGMLSAAVFVPVIGDTIPEGIETFSVVLSGAVNAAIGDGAGICTIIDND